MDYSEYAEQASEYMRLAIPMMKKYGIAMTPANYAVWYEHVAGTNVALSDALEKVIEESGQLTDQQSRDLYERFFDRERDRSALLEMRQELTKVLREVITFIYSGVVTTDKTNNHLNGLLDKLHQDMTPKQVHELIEEVLAETRLAVSAGELLNERLNTAMSEMQSLKKELDETRREAKTDTLTRLANRKAFDDLVTKVTKDADNTGMEVCLIFCDLDMFKDINDKHGHLVGDQVLKVVANTLKESVKGRDLVARYGGEEFSIILVNTSLQNAKVVAENIRQEISSKRIQRKDTHESLGVITMSFGVARYVPSEGVESFMQRADRALYMSKRKGRNSVSEAPPPII